MPDVRVWRRRLSSGALPLGLYGLTVLASLIGGVVLARGMSLEERGIAAVASVLSTLGTIWGTLGIPEFRLSRRLLTPLEKPALWAAALSTFAVTTAACATLVLLFDGMNASALVIFGLGVVCAAANVPAFVSLQLRRGLLALRSVQLAHAAMLCIATIIYWSLASHLSLIALFWIWLMAELVTGCIVRLSTRGHAGTTAGPWQPTKLTVSVRHSMAQTGNLFADRGLLFLAGLGGGPASAAAMTIAQSSASPIQMPVQALSPSILSSEAGRPARRAVALSAATALVSAPFLPGLIELAYGSRYAGVAAWGALLAVTGLQGALWRTIHLRLRASGRALTALLSDISALIVFAILALWGDLLSNQAGVVRSFWLHTLAGLVTALLALILFRRPGQAVEPRAPIDEASNAAP